jgi:Ty3 transposon capsid-like protein
VAPPVPTPLPGRIRYSTRRDAFFYTDNSGTYRVEYLGNYIWRFNDGDTFDTSEFYADPPLTSPRYKHTTATESAESLHQTPYDTPEPSVAPSPALSPRLVTPPSAPPLVPYPPPANILAAFPLPVTTMPSAPTMSSTATTGMAFKVSVPEAFNGTKAKYRAFIIQCYLYMAANTKDINDDAKKIAFVLSYMKTSTTLKTAESWKNRFVEKFLIASAPPPLPSYNEFVVQLEAEFKDSNLEAKAFAALHSLKQTGLVDEYTVAFRNLIAEAGITQDGPMIDYYRMGLKAPVVDRIYLVIPLPDTFEKWVSHATQIDQQYRERQAQKKGQTTMTTHHTPSSATKDPNAMDVDKRKTHIAKLTPEERDKCFKEGRCLACREKGHNARDCPRKTSFTSSSPRATTTPYKPKYPRREKTRKADASSDEEEQSTSTKRSKHSKATTSSAITSDGGSEGDDEEEPPSYSKAKLARSKIERILQDLSIDEWSDIAESRWRARVRAKGKSVEEEREGDKGGVAAKRERSGA